MQPRQRKRTLYAADMPADMPAPPSREQTGFEAPKPKRLPRLRKFVKRFVLTVLVLAVALIGWYGWKFYGAAADMTGNKNPLQLASIFMPTTLQSSNGRVNILLTGYSKDDPGHPAAELTDSIMILSLDPETNHAVIISIPRDMYVNIPGYGYSKINAAYEYGKAGKFSEAGYANGGIGLLEKTITQHFGLDLNYYMLINYTTFRDTVNAVGGVTLTLKSRDPRGFYDPYTHLKLKSGTQELNGQEALNLARSRGDGPGSYGFALSDFDRAHHQQQLLMALKHKASERSLLFNPVKLGNLASAVGHNVQTDMTIGEMVSLFRHLRTLPDSQLKTYSLNDFDGKNLLSSYAAPGGQSALVPALGLDDYSAIRAAINDKFSE